MERRKIYFMGIITYFLFTSVNAQYEYVPYIGERYDLFDWNLAKSLESPSIGNAIISPLSTKLVLAMLYEASTGSTEQQLQEVLSFPVSRHATRDRFLQVIASLNLTSSDETLDIGSGIFLDKSLKPHPTYEKILKTYYNSQVTIVDFANLEETKHRINSWADNITHGHVKQLIDDGGLKNSFMVLANALYFRGLWRIPFDRSRSMSAEFHLSKNKSEVVPFMIIEENYYYYEDKDVLESEIIRIPFKGNISMFIIIPEAIDGLPEVIKKLNPVLVNELRWYLAYRTITIRLPKFSFEYKAKLKDTLQDLGLNDIFEDIASLPAIKSGDRNVTDVKVSNFIQKAGIEIDEEGSKVWAASSFEIGTKFGSNRVVDVNRPFLFYLEDEITGNILFVGKVQDPLDSKTLQNDAQANVNKPDTVDKVIAPAVDNGKNKETKKQ